VKTSTVAMAVVTRMMALADVAGAVELARRLAENPHFALFHAQMLFAAGRLDEAVEHLRPHGAAGAHLIGLSGILRKNDDWHCEANALLDETSRAALEAVAGTHQASSASSVAVLSQWMEQCLRMGALQGMMQVATALFPNPQLRFASLARIGATEKL